MRDVLNSESNGADQSDDEQMNTRWSKSGSPIELNLSSNNIKELSTDDAKAFERLLENAQAWFNLFPINFRSQTDSDQCKRLYLNKNAFQEIPSRFISTAANLRELVLDENFFSRIDLSFLNDLPHLKSLRSVFISVPGSLLASKPYVAILP